MSNGVELLGAKTSKVGAIVETIFLPASVIDIEIAKTNTSFLKILDSCWNNDTNFNCYSTWSD